VQAGNHRILARIARQQWRARIETLIAPFSFAASPASPASNGGRGLKPIFCDTGNEHAAHRPPAMAGAD